MWRKTSALCSEYLHDDSPTDRISCQDTYVCRTRAAAASQAHVPPITTLLVRQRQANSGQHSTKNVDVPAQKRHHLTMYPYGGTTENVYGTHAWRWSRNHG